MSYKKATLAVLALLVIMSAAYFQAALGFQDNRNRNSIGPGYFPIGLALLLVVLCAVSAVQTLRQADRHVDLPNLGLVAAGLGVTGLFLLAWSWSDWFYPVCLAFVFALLVLFRADRGARALAVNAAVAAVLTVAVWLLFGQLIGVRF